MKYKTVKEVSIEWKVTERTIRNYCTNGKIPGAFLNGKTWFIPNTAIKPGENIIDFSDNSYIDDIINKLNSSPVSYFVIDNCRKELLQSGYKEVFENSFSNVKKGEKVFFIRNGTSIVALNIGKDIKEDNYPFHIIASHSDSPCFKIKPECDGKSDTYNRVNVEPYGGMIMSTWLDRPLSIAGRVLVKENQNVVSKLVNINKDLLLIPNLCIHFNREINQGYKFNPASDLQAFIGENLNETPFKAMLAKELGTDTESILNFDLYLYNRNKVSIWGSEREYISAPRLDDQECVFTSLKAFVNSTNDSSINVFYVTDNEEVGSSSRQGADSDFLSVVVNRVVDELGFKVSSLPVALANSFLVSADNAHAVHPNNPSITDPNNKCYMNKGIAIKFNAAQSYTSDGLSASIFQEICNKANVPYQFFTNRSDIRGGGTLGNISSSHVSVMSVDIGLPQLAMHSSYETAGVKDLTYAIEAFTKFYSSSIHIEGNKVIIKE